MATNELTIDLSGHPRAVLYKSTIREVKSHFLITGYGDGQAINRNLLDQYFDLYPLKLTGVFLYLDGIVVETDTVRFKISNSLELSDLNAQGDDQQFLSVASAFLHQLSLMYPLYKSRDWVENRSKFGSNRVFDALDSLDDVRFI